MPFQLLEHQLQLIHAEGVIEGVAVWHCPRRWPLPMLLSCSGQVLSQQHADILLPACQRALNSAPEAPAFNALPEVLGGVNKQLFQVSNSCELALSLASPDACLVAAPSFFACCTGGVLVQLALILLPQVPAFCCVPASANASWWHSGHSTALWLC